MLLNTVPINVDGICAVVSDKIIPVEEYCKGLASPKKLRKLINTTGFESLSIADPDVCCSDMCVQAADHLLALTNRGVKRFLREEIGALIFVTQSSDYRVPATAYTMQERLGLNDTLVAFDINLGCSGFVYGLYVASSLLGNLGDKKVLLCCGDVDIRCGKPTDTNSGVIFGDAGAAAIISKAEPDKKTLFNINSYGDRWRCLYSKMGGDKILKESLMKAPVPDFDLYRSDEISYMDGMGIMDFTMNEVVDNINELVSAAGLSKNDIGAYLFHQPQKLLVDDMAAKLELDTDSVIANAQHIGNASSASIPLLLTEIGSAWSERPNKRVLMSGFGVGLSVASVVMDLDDTICLETKHYEQS